MLSSHVRQITLKNGFFPHQAIFYRMHSKLSLAVAINDQYKDRCHDLAKQLSLPVCDPSADNTATTSCAVFDYTFRFETNKTDNIPSLTLGDTRGKLGSSIGVDFVGGQSGHRRRYGGGRGQPLAKAIGLKGGANPGVVDVTAGLGRDAFVLACLGAQVTLIERSPVLTALLADGMTRAQADKEISTIVTERMALVNADAIDWLENLPDEHRPDVIYMDPMYPHRNKSALVKKEMRYLREIVGDDEDACELLHAALRVAKRRVVVKRPRTAPAIIGKILNNRSPDSRVESKNTRYDIYITQAHQ